MSKMAKKIQDDVCLAVGSHSFREVVLRHVYTALLLRFDLTMALELRSVLDQEVGDAALNEEQPEQ